jgi:hypothetical protein
MLDLAASEKDVHVDFYNGKHYTTFKHLEETQIIFSHILDFDDLFDEDDL